ncbi:beta-mannosidase [Achlya hypogyna]|uniref:beta-mannosidase n=1 Tax=Achlya hypogyna TaxID=1202772 RepID=A0A1V9ZFE4_ACHHY|nr:beta-mannosidase [Achlya hypogyna]
MGVGILAPLTVLAVFGMVPWLLAIPALPQLPTSSALTPADVLWLTDWKLRSQNGSIAVAVHGPGTTHTHLLDAGVIASPHDRFNEHALRWVATEAWTYETTFYAAANCPCRLRAPIIDGPATVRVNDHHVATTTNSFLAYDFDITPYILAGANKLTIAFEPPLLFAERKARAYPYYVPATVNPNTWAEPTHRSFIRKAGCDFGWDWGPAFVSVGLPAPVSIHFPAPVCSARLDEYSIDQKHSCDYGRAYLTFHIFVSGTCNEPVTIEVWVNNASVAVVKSINTSHVQAKYTMEAPSLWWPHGYGTPYLYSLELVLATASGRRLDCRRGKFGVRSVELDQAPLDDGHAFGLVVNGRPVLARGANWVPADAFPSRVTRATLANLLSSATAVHMNMVRVWGGGRYEVADFYELCDEFGLLVWQEFMFACAAYPRDATFLASVAQEVAFQVRRLAKYTSVVVWGGNNENEAIMDQFAAGAFMPPSEPFNRDRAVTDYVKVFVDTVVPAVQAADTAGRPIVDTSPSNGLLSTTPYVKRWGNTSSPYDGDVHYYNVARDCMDWTQYPPARFVSEFGFQSMPSLAAWQRVSGSEDWASAAAIRTFMAFRQRSPNGTAHIQHQLDVHFRPLPPQGSVVADVAAYTWLTQVQQGLCYATAIGTWRRQGVRGVLYWQLNDVWVGPSWSSIEADGRWKALHAMVAAPFAPQAAVVHEAAGAVVVSILSDRPASVRVAVELRRFVKAAVVLDVHHASLSLVADVPAVAWTTDDTDTYLAAHGCDAAACFLCVSSPAFADTFHFFRPFKDLAMVPSPVATSVAAVSPTEWSVVVSAAGPVALFVTLDAGGEGRWSDNVFHVLPGRNRSVTLTLATARTPRVTVTSLQGWYNVGAKAPTT